jgi:HEAT repeat protein
VPARSSLEEDKDSHEPLRSRANGLLAGLCAYTLANYGVVPSLGGAGRLAPEWQQGFDELLGLLTSRDRKARLIALRSFADYGQLQSFAERNATPKERKHGLRQGYGSYSGRLRPILSDLLRDENKEPRLAAAATLLFIEPGHPGATRALLAAFDEPDPAIRVAACELTGSIRPPAVKAVPALVRALRAKEKAVRNAAVRALYLYGPGAAPATPVLVRMVSKDDPAAHGGVEPFPIVPQLENIALHTLGSIGQEASSAVPELVRLAGKAKPEKLPALLGCLKKIGPAAREAVPCLRRLMKDPRPAIRLRAAGTLMCVQPGDKGAAAMLSRAIRSADVETRLAAAGSLVGLSASSGVPLTAVADALRDDNEQVRLLCAETLRRMGPGAVPAAPALARMLTYERWAFQSRTAAAQALAGIGKGAVPVLLEVVRAGSRRTDAAAIVLALQRDTAITITLQPDDDVSDPPPGKVEATLRRVECSDTAAFALGLIGPDACDAVPALVKGLRKQAPLRTCTIVALGRIGPSAREALPALRAIRQEERKDYESLAIRLLADWAIGRIER